MGNTDSGFEFLKDPAPLPKRCAFCRQEVGGVVPTRCRRCAALYHSDCWAANGKRCAVYGCEPAEKPVAAAPAPERYRLPAETPSGNRGTWILVVFGIFVLRLISPRTQDHHLTPIEYSPVRIERPASLV